MCLATTTNTDAEKAAAEAKRIDQVVEEDTLNMTTTASATTGTDNDDCSPRQRRRRSKRDKDGEYNKLGNKVECEEASSSTILFLPKEKKAKKNKRSKALQKHSQDSPSGGLEALLPSLIGISILIFAVMAQRGFRGRATVAGIDLGTTNSVLCIQALSKGVGNITCVPDDNGSPIIPSIVSLLEPHERQIGPSSKTPSKLYPHPSHVVVGYQAKPRIDSHPQHTLYHAKRVLGRPYHDHAVTELQQEVEFPISGNDSNDDDERNVVFPIQDGHHQQVVELSPQQVGGYVVQHLLKVAEKFLGHSNINAAVIAVPAKFTPHQRQLTAQAFQLAGLQVQRILEEPTAAALAYGLHRKEGVEKILVYDFGGGTLDVSILHVSEGFVDVLGSDGDDRLGGADFDAAIAHHLQHQHAGILQQLSLLLLDSRLASLDTEQFISKCGRITDNIPLCSVSSFHTIGETMKIQLSQAGEATTVKANCWALPDDNSMQSQKEVASADPAATTMALCDALYQHTLTLSLDEFDTICQQLFDRAVLPIQRLLQDLSLSTSDMDEIVMVGGTTRMPQIRRLVKEQFPHIEALNTHIDPDLTVAYGAASVID